MLERNQKILWAARARTYNNLDWVNDKDLEHKLLECGKFQSHHVVLDAGTGTGVVAFSIAPYVKEVYGIDQSEAMIQAAEWDSHGNVQFRVGDIRDIPYSNGKFDRVTCRNVFHNLLEPSDRLLAAAECQRVLRNGGRFIISEGVPPHDSLKEDFERIFELKEIRITFTPDDLINLMRKHDQFHRLIIPVTEAD